MHPRLYKSLSKVLIAIALLTATAGTRTVRGDDSSFFGRLFRLGGSSDSTTASPSPSPRPAGALPYGRPSAAPANPSGNLSLSNSALAPQPMISNFNELPQTPVTTPPVADGPAQRLSPRPRVSPAVTSADPVLTRFALGRSNDGTQFGMFMQIFADGTVIDSDGVHRIRAADLRPIVETVQSGELYRLRGHCGTPSTDFIEYVHIIVYERRLGRLNAHSFSYAGNTQGCDQAIRQLHTKLENLQAKLSRQPVMTAPAASGGNAPVSNSVGSLSPVPAATTTPLPTGPAPAFAPRSGGHPSAPSLVPDAGAVIPLTPADSSN